MNNLEIIKKYKKTEILETLCKYLINDISKEAEEITEHILWLYEEMNPATKFWFFKEEFFEELNKEELKEEKEEPYV